MGKLEESRSHLSSRVNTGYALQKKRLTILHFITLATRKLFKFFYENKIRKSMQKLKTKRL